MGADKLSTLPSKELSETGDYKAAKAPSRPTIPAAATGTAVGIAKPLLELEDPLPLGVDAGVEPVDYVSA